MLNNTPYLSAVSADHTEIVNELITRKDNDINIKGILITKAFI